MQYYLAGHYKGLNACFGSGMDSVKKDKYLWVMDHLIDVLKNACPSGNSYWHNEGIVITSWINNGQTIVDFDTNESLCFDDLSSFQDFMQKKGISSL